MVANMLLRYFTSLIGLVCQFVGGLVIVVAIPTAIAFLILAFPAEVGQLGIESALGVDLVELVTELSSQLAISESDLGTSLLVLFTSYAVLRIFSRWFYSIGS